MLNTNSNKSISDIFILEKQMINILIAEMDENNFNYI